LLERHPEFEKVTVIREEGGKYLSTTTEDQVYDETGISADHNFLDVFTYRMLEGGQQAALTEPYSILLSRSMAEKLFPEGSPLGRNVIFEKKLDFKVTGVYEDLPRNSTIRPDYVYSFSTLERTEGIIRDESWNGSMMTYTLLAPGVSEAEAEIRIKNAYAEFEGRELTELEICPLSKIHLSFNGQTDYYVMLAIFGIIGVFILGMSVINYVNFSIATASTRGKEIAIRKISGAERSSLISQLLGETTLLALAASVLALIAVEHLLPVFNTFVNSAVGLDLARDWEVIVPILGGTVLLGMLAGIYPARVISSRNVVNLVKEGVFSSTGARLDVRKVLVITQFSISMFLICLTLFFILQINHMSTMDLGFNRSNLLYTHLSNIESDHHFEQFRNRLVRHPGIENLSMSSGLPFVRPQGGMVNWEGGDPEDKVTYRPNWVSYDYAETMELSIILGRDFSEQFQGDLQGSCLISETAWKCFGWDDPIGKKINDNRWTVIGVVEDFHIMDIHNQIDPAVLLLSDDRINGNKVFEVRYTTGMLREVREYLTQEFELLFPTDPFEFRSMESAIENENSFKIYQSIKKSVFFFALFIVLLAIISLLSLVSYSIDRRTKEIGIRKINGSSVRGLFLLLNRDYFVLLGISLVVALPVAYLTYRALPGNFKIPPPFWVPFSAVMILAVIILVSTGYQTYKAARRNPVEALRYE
jgi:putative ABC transport system permease protein